MSNVLLSFTVVLGGIVLLGAISVIMAALNPPKEYKGAK